MKQMTFSGKRPSTAPVSTADDWVKDRSAINREPTKRFTIDVPVSLHKWIKSHCALQNVVMADVIRELLEQRFPQAQSAEPGRPS
jgi:hypothetical protein